MTAQILKVATEVKDGTRLWTNSQIHTKKNRLGADKANIALQLVLSDIKWDEVKVKSEVQEVECM